MICKPLFLEAIRLRIAEQEDVRSKQRKIKVNASILPWLPRDRYLSLRGTIWLCYTDISAQITTFPSVKSSFCPHDDLISLCFGLINAGSSTAECTPVLGSSFSGMDLRIWLASRLSVGWIKHTLLFQHNRHTFGSQGEDSRNPHAALRVCP